MPKLWKQARTNSQAGSGDPTHNTCESKIFGAELSGNAPLVDLHGFDVLSGIHTLDLFLHSAFANGHDTVKVIHGRGTGKMRDAVRAFLKTEPLVEYFRDSHNPTEMSGVTYVVLVKSSA